MSKKLNAAAPQPALPESVLSPTRSTRSAKSPAVASPAGASKVAAKKSTKSVKGVKAVTPAKKLASPDTVEVAKRQAKSAATKPARTSAPTPSQTPLQQAEYWEEACKYLVKKDRILRRIIPKYQGAGLESRGDAFSTLARSIVGQQISTSAAAAVWSRFEKLVPGKLTAAKVLALEAGAMRASGLSMRKVEYLSDLALHFQEKRLNAKAWVAMEDEAIIAELVAVRGIGRWTAEMFLMFHLLRPNVLPLDDAGLIQGISRNYFSGEPVSRSDVREVAQAWQPWRSVATWYMWRSLAQPQAY